MIKNGWLYAFFVFLAQTCNPYYSSNEMNDGRSDVVEIPVDAFELEDEITLEDIEMSPPSVREEAPPPPPPPPMPEEERIFKVVENTPRFHSVDCEAKSNERERRKCSDDEMLKFLYSRIMYPAEARKNGVQGTVILQFTIEKDGAISNVKILRDPGAGLGEEAVRVVKMMPNWIPGTQRGQKVRVRYNLPVKFKVH